MVREYEQIADALCRDEVAHHVRHSRVQRLVLGALVSAALASVGAAAWLGSGSQTLRKQTLSAGTGIAGVMSQYSEGGQGRCGNVQADTDYEFDEPGAFGTHFDHIPSAEWCCALCQGEPRCKAFVWVKDAGLDGNPSQCWLKGGVGTAVPKAGFVAGVPPPTPALTSIPSGVGSAGGTMFCISLMVPTGYEPGLIQWQYNNKASIFGCDGYQVYSNQNVTIAPGVVTAIVDSDLKCGYGGDSQSALNAWIFIAVWDKIIDDAVYRRYDWTVKVDPDCVFFPHRLAPILVQNQGAAYINNCKYGMHGPIEVFGRAAVDGLASDYAKSFDGKAPKECVEKQSFGQWGEDMFIDQCLTAVLQVAPRATDTMIMCESHCDCPDYFWCQSGDRAAYHPFKTIDQYKTCMANALAAGGILAPAAGSYSAPEAVSSAVPPPASYGSYGAPQAASYAAPAESSYAAPAAGSYTTPQEVPTAASYADQAASYAASNASPQAASSAAPQAASYATPQEVPAAASYADQGHAASAPAYAN